MSRTKLVAFLIALNCVCAQAETFNLLGVIEVTVPKEFEILSVTGRFMTHKSSPQYNFGIYIEIIYKTAWLPMAVNFFGSKDLQAAAAVTRHPGKVEQYYSNYNTADQPKFLLSSFEKDPKFTKTGLKYSRFASDWPSGFSANYVGYYFKIQNELFSEAIIGVLNSWGAFPPVETLDFNEQKFDEKLSLQNEDTKSYFALLQGMIDSIAIPPRSGLKILDSTTQFWTYKVEDGLYVPSISNLRLRDTPSRNGSVVGKVPQTPHRIIGLGPEETIDGIRGRWVRIVPIIGNKAGWAFNGYLRKASKKELEEFYQGI